MSENCNAKSNANLTTTESLALSNAPAAAVGDEDDAQIACEHMYATHHEQNGLLAEDAAESRELPCHSTESEVNFIKDFLLIHLDLIQQQNDDIISKESSLYLLQEENFQLREKIKLLEAKLEESSKTRSADQERVERTNHIEDMVIDSTTLSVESNQIVPRASCAVKQPEEARLPLEAAAANGAELVGDKSELREAEYSSHYTIHSTGSDPMKNLKMSIRRKRLCSTSSALSNNGSASGEKKTFYQSRKKRKRFVNNDCLLTQSDEYLTQVGDGRIMDILRRQELAEDAAKVDFIANLEVPRWRVKVYTSCYSLEGTENLEEDSFLRRHSRMENDEKRRKRWDVQRIREQRVIEKLKLRQEKIDNNRMTLVDDNPAVVTLWPTLDDIKFIEKSDELPVAAFGAPIPILQPSAFSLPWLNLLLTGENVKKSLGRSSNALLASTSPSNNVVQRKKRSSKR